MGYTATWTKSPTTGEWGVRVVGDEAAPGARLTVSKKDGTSKEVTVRALAWREENVSIYTVESDRPAVSVVKVTPAQVRRAPSRGNWRPCGYPGCSPNYCDECDGEGYKSSYRSRY
jgi:hypothetical protein